MNDYRRLQDELEAEKSAFDKTVTSNPHLSPAEKELRWNNLNVRLQPKAGKLRLMDEAIERRQAAIFERKSKQVVERIAI